MRKIIVSVILQALLVASCMAQSVQQSGTVTRGHVPYWVTSGVIADGGSSADSPISSIGVTNNGGAGFCVSSDRQTAAGRNQLCFGASTNAPSTISLQNYGTATPQGLNFVINGTIVSIPTGGSTFIFGNGPFTVGHVPCFTSTGGVVQDCGLALNSGTITSGVWNGSPIAIANGGTGATTQGGAQAALGLGSMATQNANTVAITGGTITGMPTPTNTTDVAIKSYVDATSQGLIVLAQSRLATAAVLPNSPTYSNGTLGVGATLTAGSNTTLTVDGTSTALNDVILVKNQAAPAQNGIYTQTQVGTGSVPWILTRATYFDQAAEIKAGSYTFITAGSANINSSWVLQTTVTTVGTDAVTFNQFASSSNAVTSIGGSNGVITLTNGLQIAGNALGATAGVPANILNSQTANYSIATTDCNKLVQAGTGSTGVFTVTLPSVSGFASTCTVSVLNADTSTLSGKLLSGFPTGCVTTKYFLWPGQTLTVSIENGAWVVTGCPGLYVPTAAMSLLVGGGGASDTTGDGFTVPFATIGHCIAAYETQVFYQSNLTQPTCLVANGTTFTESAVHYVPIAGTNTLNITGNGGTFTWKPSGSNPFSLAMGNYANVQVTNVTFSGAGTTCGTAGTCTLVIVHNAAIFETLTGVSCVSPGNGGGDSTAGNCIKTDLNASGGTRINIDNGFTVSGTGNNLLFILGNSYVNWNGALAASGATSFGQIFSAFGQSTILLQGNFSTSGSFGTPRQYSMQGLSIIMNSSGTVVPGTAGILGTGSLSCSSLTC